mmetsp:Transcript_25925/g.71391  ORF Transcript_25925/g.71391 Transcript_25925/m.71391 type:complete len:80 (-) Transcript_25925:43-282(-)
MQHFKRPAGGSLCQSSPSTWRVVAAAAATNGQSHRSLSLSLFGEMVGELQQDRERVNALEASRLWQKTLDPWNGVTPVQ